MEAPRIPAGVACQSTSANAYRHLGRLDEALAAIEEAGEMLKHVEFAGETQRKGLEFGVLWRRGVILGEADAPNLGRDKEAIASLRDAYSMMEEIARRDRAETSSRIRLSTAGRELAEILVKTDPAGALAIRKHCLSRLAEVATGRAARTAEVWHLAGSAEALRKLGDVAEAERSLAQAFERLGELGVYPVLQGRLADEARFALRTKAEHLAATGRTREAVRTSEEWLHLEAPLAEQRTEQLPLAFRTWSQWLRLAEWNRALGRTGEAEEYYQQAVVLWGIWKAKLPQNQFVAAQSRYFEERSAARR
ncbi:MAG: hypothetical protein U5J83_02080 [Bryobacterales bacterium]|nr:hypothetical protein [Bryobacterales bacterium]